MGFSHPTSGMVMSDVSSRCHSLSESFSTEKEGKGKAFRMCLQGFSPRNFFLSLQSLEEAEEPLEQEGIQKHAMACLW